MFLLVIVLFTQRFCGYGGVVQPLRLCGKPQNTVQLFRSAKAGAELFAACKKAIIEANVKPAIIKEKEVLCTVLRLCYAWVEDFEKGWLATYGYRGETLDKFLDCGKGKFPVNIEISLGSMVWGLNIISG